jgi:tetratricopeptide (TPR) repeat protein
MGKPLNAIELKSRQYGLVHPLATAGGIADHVRELHTLALFNAGLAEQRAGHAVAAEEDYAMVLSIYPTNKFVRFNMGLLEQDAGRIDQAISLYEEVPRKDPNFTPAKRNMEYIVRTHFRFPNMHPR